MADNNSTKNYRLLDANGKAYESDTKGTLGGHRKHKIYGRLDCPSALRYIAKRQHVKNRVFFADEGTAIAAGYRPCAKCMPKEYAVWKTKKLIVISLLFHGDK
ncbi:Ada metal-binding domain-containing protein [Desulfosporosinus sp. Sb-LF]|uniref:Ada metal-binding domain-containing protein n=1 Tax=Desulfosporosinus sp. Sb-LF TaxID=2560027 RepID=UPI00107F32C5|nr:Ada metal-binding domain-containing protein [Desulfosporosinus sp. Sb-LF]TGE31751.1 metal-binding protein [Desulfosporosinus sp. Sb-LF]